MVKFPDPVPGWFFVWEVWRHKGAKKPRPAELPTKIPQWAWTLYHRRLPKPPPAVDDGGNSLWDRLGMVKKYADSGADATLHGKRCLEFGYGYAACSVHTDLGSGNNSDSINRWLYNVQVGANWSIRAGGWGPDFNLAPEEAANRAARAVHAFDLAFYLPNWEKSYEHNDKVERWLSVFRPQCPSTPLMGMTLGFPYINHKLLQDLGLDTGPEAYYGENGMTAEWATWAHLNWPVPPWKASRVHPGINIGYAEVSEIMTKELYRNARNLGSTGGYGWGEFDHNKPQHWRCLT